MRLLLIAAAVLLSSLGVAPVNIPDPFEPQICPVMVDHFYQVAGHDAYVASMSVKDAAQYSGSITLFSDTDAYEVSFDRLQIDHQAPLTIRVPSAAAINFVSMDTAGKTSSAAISCPTFVVPLGNDIDSGALLPTGVERTAAFRSKLPAPPCGKVFEEGRVLKRPELPYDYAAVKRAAATVKVYVNSDGQAVHAAVVQSSGNSVADEIARRYAATTLYRPRYFLCVPIMSTFLMRVTYENI